MTDSREIKINVPILARVEGEGALDIEVRNNSITSLKLKIFEPPRLFEKLLEGRSFQEIIDIVARICGICPVAYQMSAAQAIEAAFEVQVQEWASRMRRVMYCGEWIESHALHIHLLALPDFLNFPSVVEMAKVHPEIVNRGLRLQALGNKIIRQFGGRSVHPVGLCAGGFYSSPADGELAQLQQAVQQAVDDARDLLEWVVSMPLPKVSQTFCSVALQEKARYAIDSGRIVSSEGLDIDIADYADHFKEHQVPYSTALHATLQGKPYLVGPLARMNLNYDALHAPVKEILNAAGYHFPSGNMYHSIVARAAEIYYAVLEALALLQAPSLPASPEQPANVVEVTPKASIGYGCTEAPRGLLWHRYAFDEQGYVKSARIVPPTSQNQAQIEKDLLFSLNQHGYDRPDEEIRQQAEVIVRNYDPCISCATHFLTMNIVRRE